MALSSPTFGTPTSGIPKEIVALQPDPVGSQADSWEMILSGATQLCESVAIQQPSTSLWHKFARQIVYGPQAVIYPIVLTRFPAPSGFHFAGKSYTRLLTAP
jgi:hypothetical protein